MYFYYSDTGCFCQEYNFKALHFSIISFKNIYMYIDAISTPQIILIRAPL